MDWRGRGITVSYEISSSPRDGRIFILFPHRVWRRASAAPSAHAHTGRAERFGRDDLRRAREGHSRDRHSRLAALDVGRRDAHRPRSVGRALRHGDTWFALYLESGLASLDMRGGSLALALESLRPKGYSKESFAKKPAATLDAARIKQILDTVEEGRQAFDVPGVAISLIQGGKVIYEGGLGVRELGSKAKVDADTLFIIASNTKALSTLLLAKEIDEGKFTWETPVTKVYPDFKLGDPATTSQVLMKHLVCACTELPRQDLEWIFEYKQATSKSVLGVLGTFQPTTKFGESFQYSNLMAAAAGFIGGHVAYPEKELGAAYDEAMKTKIFTPLGMTTTTFETKKALGGNHATPHAPTIDGVMKIAATGINDSVLPIRPAGGAWSSARELTRYVQMELDKGKLPNGKALVSEANLLTRRAAGEDRRDDDLRHGARGRHPMGNPRRPPRGRSHWVS